MKKFMLILAGILLLSVTGCGSSISQAEGPGPSAEVSGTGNPQATTPPEEFDLKVLIAEFHGANIEKIINDVNTGMVSELGYTLDSEAELESIRFYDMFFTSKDQTELNDSDLIVRYAMLFDGNEEESLYVKLFKISDDIKRTVQSDFTHYKSMGLMLEYLYNNSEDISDNGKKIYHRVDERILNLSDNAYLEIDESFWAYLMESLQDPEL